MAKAKTSTNPAQAKSKEFLVTKDDPLSFLTNEENVGLAILECLRNNDPEGVMEIVSIYLNALNSDKN